LFSPLQGARLLVFILAQNGNKVRHSLGVAFATADRAIRRLVEEGIVTPVGDARRGRVYCAKEILAILEEPAKLTP
jgi:Fic family protein